MVRTSSVGKATTFVRREAESVGQALDRIPAGRAHPAQFGVANSANAETCGACKFGLSQLSIESVPTQHDGKRSRHCANIRRWHRKFLTDERTRLGDETSVARGLINPDAHRRNGLEPADRN